MRKDNATEPTAMPPISVSENRNLRPKRPLMAAPSSGSRGTNQMYLYISPLQQIDFVYPDGFFIAIECDDNAQTDRRFGSGHDDYKNGEDLARDRVHAARFLEVTRKGDKVEIGGVENQLDRHEDDDDVAPRQHSRHADDEKQRSDHEKLRQVGMRGRVLHLRETAALNNFLK